MGLTRPRAYQIFDLDYKQSVRVVTVSNVTLSGGAPNSVDGVNLSLNDRVLVTGQNTASQNGLYYVTTVGTGSNGTWARSVDGDQTGEIDAGMIIMVTEGTIYADTQWKLITNDPIVVGSTGLIFVQNYSANSISSGSSNVVVNANANVTISSGGTANVLTVSSTGTVTTGTASVSGNITSGNISATNHTGTTVSVTGNITGGNILGGANVNATTHTGTTVSVTANITGGNILTGGLISATGNITGGNINTAGAVRGFELFSTQSSGDEGGQLNLALAAANTTLSGGVVIDVWQNRVRIFESGGTNRGGFFDLSTANAGVGTNYGTGGGGGGGTPGGSNTQIQFNDSGTFGGSAGFTFNKTTNAVATTGTLSATGNIDGGNIRTAGLVSATGTVTGSSFSGAGTGLTGTASSLTVGTATVAGTVTTNAQPNITSVGTLTSLSVTGNITGGNINGAGTGLTGTASSLTVGSATTAGTVTTAAQPNITSVGTLSSLTVTANVAGGNLTTAGQVSATGNVNGGNIVITGNIVDTGALTIITSSNGNITMAPNGTGVVVFNTDIRNGQANGVGNIGTTGGFFNTIFAKATSAQYADLAEMYVSDADYSPGTVVEFGGKQEITITTRSHSTAVAGIISTNPSYLMNSTQDGEHVLPVALTGRVPCRVQGPVNKGDVLVSSETPGVAQRIGYNWQPGCTVGKSMENILDNAIHIIEVAVGRL